ncbi:hypothetical protein AB0M47_20960 [Hamadaea sp. NPDC051192]|uniref:hypothetical protein n=1 Tax=Hamadaea sp. NPDC051192 TaxID=3154940 RepID=UPI00343B0FE9
MYRYKWRPIANGLRTDHPIPDLPFVDDSHIPVDDPDAVEKVGRKTYEGMWGRKDTIREGDGWVAYTTDPLRTDLAWSVRFDPQHGRTVVLHKAEDASGVHMAFWGPALLYRFGGYWWDGTTWFRPLQVWDRASETYIRRVVPGAHVVTAADLRAMAGDPDKAAVLSVIDVDPDQPHLGTWADDLALWTREHLRRGGLPLEQCVVTATAPELAADQLIGSAELAEHAGMVASTLRAYMARGENNVPDPQVTLGRRSLWSRPVAEEYAEARRQSPEEIAATMNADGDRDNLSRGVADLWQRFTRQFTYDLWERAGMQWRWARRWRTEASVAQVAEQLGWHVATGLDHIVPMQQLATTIQYAILGDLAAQQAADASIRPGEPDAQHFYGLVPALANTLTWYIRHDPSVALGMLGELIGQAERQLHIPRDITVDTLLTGISMDGQLADNEMAAFEEFFARLLPDQAQ